VLEVTESSIEKFAWIIGSRFTDIEVSFREQQAADCARILAAEQETRDQRQAEQFAVPARAAPAGD
jgi:hypothetical protein